MVRELGDCPYGLCGCSRSLAVALSLNAQIRALQTNSTFKGHPLPLKDSFQGVYGIMNN